jgi:SAM-dependent methyltransferase
MDAAATRMLLQAAGIGSGMRVLDLGSGTGDVAFVAAELVGPAGEVVGIDSSPEAVATAKARAQQRALGNVRFVVGDIHAPAPMLPLIERTGVATAQQVGIETLQARLAEELAASQAVAAHPMLLSAWGRVG